MNYEEYKALEKIEKSKNHFYLHMLTNKNPRTLVYGYTEDRKTFHLYLDENEKLTKVIYSGQQDDIVVHSFEQKTMFDVKDLIPNGRMYPEACDLEFCLWMSRKMSDPLPFTTFSFTREPKQFVGFTLPSKEIKDTVYKTIKP